MYMAGGQPCTCTGPAMVQPWSSHGPGLVQDLAKAQIHGPGPKYPYFGLFWAIWAILDRAWASPEQVWPNMHYIHT